MIIIRSIFLRISRFTIVSLYFFIKKSNRTKKGINTLIIIEINSSMIATIPRTKYANWIPISWADREKKKKIGDKRKQLQEIEKNLPNLLEFLFQKTNSNS